MNTIKKQIDKLFFNFFNLFKRMELACLYFSTGYFHISYGLFA